MLGSALLCFVIGITDGDTIKARCGSPGAYHQVTVRLAAIDAPERRQPFGAASRQHLADLCFEKPASISPRTKDRYGRMVADVSCQGRDAGAHMVASGMAWVFERYATPRDAHLRVLQSDARAARSGLWSDPAPIEPWAWRPGTHTTGQ